MIDKGSQVLYAEFEQNERTKRFVVPQGEWIEEKIKQFVRNTPGLDLVRLGNATVASKVDSDEASVGLVDIPSTVTAIFNLDVYDHPVLNQGQGRYSPELIKAIMETELVSAPPVAPVVSSVEKVEVEKPKVSVSLTDQLKQQMAQKAVDKLASDKIKKEEEFVKVSAPSTPVVEKKEELKPTESNMSLSEFIEKNKKEKQPLSLFEKKPQRPAPVSKIDRILEKIERIEISLGLQEELEMAEDTVRGEQLKDWFESHVESVGWDRTFEILAGKIKI